MSSELAAERWHLAVGRSKREGICALKELQSLLCFLAGGFFRFSSSESELSLLHPMGRGKVLGGGIGELNTANARIQGNIRSTARSGQQECPGPDTTTETETEQRLKHAHAHTNTHTHTRMGPRADNKSHIHAIALACYCFCRWVGVWEHARVWKLRQ